MQVYCKRHLNSSIIAIGFENLATIKYDLEA